MSNETQTSQITINNIKIDKNKFLHQVTYQDLILFKEDLLKELRNYKVKISNSVKVELDKYSDLLEKSNRNLNYYEKDKSLFMSKLDFVEEREKLFTEVVNKTSELKNEVMTNQVHISSCQKDIENACYKYDKVISENLLVPRIIGKSCKFGNLKEYIVYNKEEMNNITLSNRQNANDLTVMKKKFDTHTTQINNIIKSLEYRLSNFVTTKFHELNGKFEQLYEELNKRMNSLSYEVNSNIEERKNEIARLKNFVFEENNKAIESVKTIKDDMISEFDLMKQNFKKIKKNIVGLTNLLMGRSHNMNKQIVINNFNNMMLELFKEFNITESLQVKKPEIQQTKTFKKSVRPAVDSCIKQYIEGKISVNDAKFHGEKVGNKRKKSFQLNDRMLLGFNKDEVQHALTLSNNNNNNSSNNNINNSNNNSKSRNDNSAKINKSSKARYSQVITFNPNILEKKIMPKTEPKKSGNLVSNKDIKDISQFKIETFNNIIERTNTTILFNNKKNLSNNEVINEEDSNKYSSSKSNNNSFETKNKKNEKRKSSYNLVKQKSYNLNLSLEKNNKKINIFPKNNINSINIDKDENKNKVIEFSENSSSSINLDNSTEIQNRNYFINSPGKPIPKAAFKKSHSKDFKLSEDFTDYNNNNVKIENNENNKKDFINRIKNIEFGQNKKNEELKQIDKQNLENKKQNKYENENDMILNKRLIVKQNQIYENEKENVNQNIIIKNKKENANQNKILKKEENIISQNKIFKSEENSVNQNKILKHEKENAKNQNIEVEKSKYIEEYKSFNNNAINLEKIKTKKNDENNKNSHKKKQKISLSSENTLNVKTIDKIHSNTNIFNKFKTNVPHNTRKEANDKISFLNKASIGTKLNLKKKNEKTRIRNASFFKSDNNYNNVVKTQYDKFQVSSNKIWANGPRINSPFKVKQEKENNLINSPSKENIVSTSKNSNNVIKSVPSSRNRDFFNNKTRNRIFNNIEENKQFNTFDIQAAISNNNKNINGVPLILKTDIMKKSKKFDLERVNVLKDDKDIYLSKDTIKNTRYVKDEDIIDEPLILDMNTFKMDQKKGSLENRIIELEYFTKKKLDELVREIKIYIPIHFNSHIRNYSVDKSK